MEKEIIFSTCSNDSLKYHLYFLHNLGCTAILPELANELKVKLIEKYNICLAFANMGVYKDKQYQVIIKLG